MDALRRPRARQTPRDAGERKRRRREGWRRARARDPGARPTLDPSPAPPLPLGAFGTEEQALVAYDRAVWRARGRGAPRNFPAADPGRDPFVLAREGGTWAEFVGDLRAWGQSTFPGDGGRPAASRAARAARAPARSGKRKRDESKVVSPPASLFPPTTNALDVVRAAAAGVAAARAAAAAAANPVPRADAVAILDALLAAQSEPAPHALAAIEAQARVVSLARGGERGWVATALRQVAPLSPPPSPADWDLDHLPPRTSRTDGWGGAW